MAALPEIINMIRRSVDDRFPTVLGHTWDEIDQLAKGIPVRDPSSIPKVPGVWKHKYGGRYEIVEFCVIEEGCVPAVLYRSLKDGSLWIRPCSNFFDGRFQQIGG